MGERERVLLEASFTPEAIRYYVLVSTMTFAVFGLFALILVPFTFGISLLGLGIPVAVYFIARWYYRLYFQRLSCVLTTRSLRIGKGLLFRQERAVPLDKITDMGMVQGPLMRWLGLEAMSVETAGSTGGGKGGALVTMVGIVDSRAFREAVLAQRDAVTDREAPAAGAAAVTAPAGEGVLVEIRDALLRIEGRLGERSERDRAGGA